LRTESNDEQYYLENLDVKQTQVPFWAVVLQSSFHFGEITLDIPTQLTRLLYVANDCRLTVSPVHLVWRFSAHMKYISPTIICRTPVICVVLIDKFSDLVSSTIANGRALDC
jgi:hypothetical protein